jgi:hypothetical protein
MSIPPRRLTNSELASRRAKAARFSESTPEGELDDEALAIAPAALVETWMNQGKLEERYGIAPQKQRGRR